MIKHDEDYKLEKSIWTTEDFETMGWHDSQIHGISFDAENYKIIFDIDYIYAWVEPAPESEYFSFWVSPCTLVFENCYDLIIDLDLIDSVEIKDLTRHEKRVPRNSEFINKSEEWKWIFECSGGEISFRSIGYAQYTRKKPEHINAQSFDKQSRQGVKFDIITNL